MIDGCKIGVTLDVQPLDATYVSRTFCVLWKKQMLSTMDSNICFPFQSKMKKKQCDR